MTRLAQLVTACLTATAVAGCAASRKAGTASATPAPTGAYEESVADAPPAAPGQQQAPGWSVTPLPFVSEPVSVKEGTAPLVYLVESPGIFRIHDRTAGHDIASGPAAARSIVRIDGRHGVIFGSDTLLAGPIDPSHRYVIYRDPRGENLVRQGVFQGAPRQAGAAPSPVSQPQPSQPQTGGLENEGGPRADR